MVVMMKKNLKRIILLLLMSFTLIDTPFLPVTVSAKENLRTDDILIQLGIIDENIAASEEIVTRGEFAVMVSDILTWNNLAKSGQASKQIFSDVSQWDWISSYLEFLSDRNIIHGYDDGSFRPDEAIDLCSAYSILLNVLGYREYVLYNNVYPDSVMKIAAFAELDEGFESFPYSQRLTGKTAAALLENMLSVNVMEFSGISGSDADFETGEIFLSEYMNLYEYKGIVTGVPGVSTSGSRVRDGEVEIDGVNYTNAVNNIEGLFGNNVTYYLEQNDDGSENRVMIAVAEQNNYLLELDADTIISYNGTDRELVYTMDNGRSKKLDISGTADIICNGEIITETETFVPDYGKIKLINNNGDSKYDVVVISDYQTIIVNSVDVQRGIIYGKNKDRDGNSYQLQPEDFEYYSITDIENNSVKLEDIQKNTVLTGEISYGSYMNLVYSQQTASGIVSSMAYNINDRLEVKIADTVYKVVDNVYSPNVSLKLNSDCEVLLDFKGCIAAVMNASGSSWEFGYMSYARIDSDNNCITLKLLSESGDNSYINCTEDLKIDGDKSTSLENAVSKLQSAQLVRYRKKDGLISAIDLADRQAMDDFTPIADDDNNSLLKRAYSYLRYKSAVSSFKRYSTTNRPKENLDYEVMLSADTVIFSVPAEEKDIPFTEPKVLTKSDLKNNQSCYIESFNTSAGMLKSQAVVIYENTTRISDSARPLIVDKITTVLNKDDEVTYKITGVGYGMVMERTLKSAEVLTLDDGNSVKKGDIIRTRQDSDGFTTKIDLLYTSDPERKGRLNKSPVYDGGADLESTMRCVMGKITNKTDDVFVLTYGTAEKKSEIFPTSNFAVYVCDADGPETEDIYIGTAGDIPEVNAGDESEETVIVCTNAGSPLEIIVIK